jgi:hypothetical protein
MFAFLPARRVARGDGGLTFGASFAFGVAIVAFAFVATIAEGQAARSGPDTVEVHNGSVTLRALLWRPKGRGPFPAILLNHGSGRTPHTGRTRGTPFSFSYWKAES